MVGARGILLDPDENTLVFFECGMGLDENNQAKRYKIFMGLENNVFLSIQKGHFLGRLPSHYIASNKKDK